MQISTERCLSAHLAQKGSLALAIGFLAACGQPPSERSMPPPTDIAMAAEQQTSTIDSDDASLSQPDQEERVMRTQRALRQAEKRLAAKTKPIAEGLAGAQQATKQPQDRRAARLRRQDPPADAASLVMTDVRLSDAKLSDTSHGSSASAEGMDAESETRQQGSPHDVKSDRQDAPSSPAPDSDAWALAHAND